MIATVTRVYRAVSQTTTGVMVHPDSTSGYGSRHLAHGDGEGRQSDVGGAGEGGGGGVTALPHLLGAPACADVEGTIHHGVHA